MADNTGFVHFSKAMYRLDHYTIDVSSEQPFCEDDDLIGTRVAQTGDRDKVTCPRCVLKIKDTYVMT